ncbi:MAG: Gfo/Idh/MocA family oxidoreductase [Gammaproteobacteria bacterium]|nr:Gfo/Idh/MocA family oxidoreductase [Gammaproteobacteria bacterium]
MAKLRIAIVGLGMAVTPHAQSYLQLRDRVEVVYAFSPSAERRRAFAEKFPFPLADGLDQILADNSVGIVTLLTPPNTHLELVRRCAQAGKHILLEKPLEISAARCTELVELCEAHCVTLGVVLQHRFRAGGEHLHDLLEKGALGRIVSASVTILNWRPQAYYDEPGRGDRNRDGSGVLLTQGIHTLDLYLSLVGMPEQVFAYACTSAVHEMETEDLVAGCQRFAGGALGTVHATTTAYPGLPEGITIIGESATAHLSGTSLNVAYHDGRRESHQADGSSGGAGADPMAFPNDYHRAVITDFLDALEQRRVPRVSGREALKVHRLIDCLLQSAETGEPVAI